MQLANAMTSNPITVGSRDTLATAKSLMDAGRFRRLPVVDDGRLVGILTERDIREHTSALDRTRVNAAMRTGGHHRHTRRQRGKGGALDAQNPHWQGVPGHGVAEIAAHRQRRKPTNLSRSGAPSHDAGAGV